MIYNIFKRAELVFYLLKIWGDIMPRRAREKSSTGIYHIMSRGIDKRNIFLTEEDYSVFLNCVKRAKEKGEFSLLAYCLMTNHVHLLIKEGSEDIGNSVSRINVAYAHYHNRRYDRTGHLFQNRYRSETVNDENYLLVVTRYIHQNPLKAGLVNDIFHYQWSSYKDFFTDKRTIIDRDLTMAYFSTKDYFVRFHHEENDDKCLDYIVRKTFKDAELRGIIEDIIEIEKLHEMKNESRNKFIRRIKTETGASIRQLERVLCLGRNIIQRA